MDKAAKPVMLSMEKLEVLYNNVSRAIHGVTLEVRDKQIVALLGNNGAGKTTTLRAVSGFLSMDNAKVAGGFIRFRGEKIQNRPPHVIAKKGIIMVPEQDKIFENLTVEENLQVSAMQRGTKGKTKELYELIFQYFPTLEKLRSRVGGYLSGGERQMLSISTALLCRPVMLLVDELSLGLAPIIVEELMKLIKVIRDNLEITVLLVEQNASAALDIADYAYIIENGRIAFSGDPLRLKENDEVREFYLGRGEGEKQKSYRNVKQYRRTKRLYG